MKRLAFLFFLLLPQACTGFPIFASRPSPAPRGTIRAGEVVVAWPTPPDPAAAATLRGRLGAELLAGDGAARQLWHVRDGTELSCCTTLRREPGVTHAEPNFVVRSQHLPGSFRTVGSRRLALVPNDPGHNVSSPLAGQSSTWGLAAIRAEAAWDVTAGDPAVVVAVIDTGADMNHPDLAANLDRVNAANFVETGKAVDDDFGHGTHVAGIIAAVGNNKLGSLGVAWRARIMPIRVLGVDGSGSTYNTVAAIEHAVSHGARVINMSLGSPDNSEFEAEAIAAALAAGVVVVAAAGNEATVGNYPEYPAGYAGVLSVGAVGPDLKRAAFSNYNSSVSLVAPGVDILSTIPSRMSPEPYGYLSGTSMAAPMVSGAAALVWTVHPHWTAAQVSERLRRTTRELAPIGDIPGFDVYFGNGLLDASRAVTN